MKKIPTMFIRSETDRSRVTDVPNPECRWVFEGEGVATAKMDGTCARVKDGRLYKRHEVKKGGVPPANFEEADFDEVTGKRQGWVPVGDGPEDRWHREGFEGWASIPDGTYELCGPKVQGNPYNLDRHVLLRHGSMEYSMFPRTFAAIREFLEANPTEGIVFWRDADDPDCDKAKVKRRDFGLPWPVK